MQNLFNKDYMSSEALELAPQLVMEYDTITVDTYLELRASVGWKKLTREQAEKALKNSLCTRCVRYAGRAVGMGRIVGDGSVVCYIQDLIVRPEAQGLGVGSMLMESLTAYVKSIMLDDTEMMFDLMCAKGREAFYEMHGFTARPTENLGPGMIRYFRKKSDNE